MELKKFLKTYKQTLLTAGAALGSLLVLFMGVYPLAQKTYALWKSSTAMADDIKAMTGKSAILQSLDETTLRTSLLALTTAVPTDKSIGSILNTLDGVAGIDVIIQDFQLTKVGSIATDSAKKLSADEARIGAHIIPFSVSVNGTFDNIQAFLGASTSVRRLFSLRAVDLTFSPLTITARVNLDAYHFPLPTAIGGLTKPITVLNEKEEATLTKVSSLPLQSSGSVAVGTASAVPGGKSDPFSP